MVAKVIVLVIASQGFQEMEYAGTKQELEKAGFKVVTVSDKSGKALGHAGKEVAVDFIIDQINPEKYDGIFLIGGPGALTCLDTVKVYELVKKTVAQQKPVGAICIAPRILAKAGVLNNKKATSWDGDNKTEALFEKYAVICSKDHVVTDGKIVTADGPAAAHDFGKALVDVMKKSS